MSDDVLDELKSDWRGQEAPLEVLGRRLHRSRVWTTLALAIELAMTVGGVLAGLWFAVVAWRLRDPFFGLSALTLLFICPLFSLELYRLRWRSLNWADRTPEGTLRYALARVRLARSILHLQTWSGLALLLFVGAVWGGVFMGWISRRYPLWTLTVVWASAAAGTILWSKWRLWGKDHEYRTCERLLSTFANAAESGSE